MFHRKKTAEWRATPTMYTWKKKLTKRRLWPQKVTGRRIQTHMIYDEGKKVRE